MLENDTDGFEHLRKYGCEVRRETANKSSLDGMRKLALDKTKWLPIVTLVTIGCVPIFEVGITFIFTEIVGASGKHER
jgi:hypothetical protein